MLYFKSSLTGDEKDYILDYKKRNPDFPHETTSDQFFTEEQFESYRSLGYHVVSRYFLGDEVSWQNSGLGRWKELAVAKREILEALGLTKPKEVTTEPKKEFVDVELKEAAHS